MDCVSECRLIGRSALEAVVTCEVCSEKLTISRMLANQTFRALLEIAEVEVVLSNGETWMVVWLVDLR